MSETARELVDRAWRAGVAPEPRTTISEWADASRYLSSKSSPEPGRWRTSRVPYLQAIMDDLSPTAPTERVVVMAAAQVGKSEAGLNWLGYIIDRAPAPIMAVLPTVETAKRTSKQRVDELVSMSPTLRDKIRPARERDSGNTILQKDFAGGTLILTGANSAVGLRSMPVRFLYLDEMDGYPVDADGEGDPVNLAIARTSNFVRRKILMTSTPSIDGASRIQDAFNQSDQRYYYVPCPECQEKHVLRFKDVVWTPLDRPPSGAAWCCPGCGSVVEHRHKVTMLANGEWRASAEGDGRTAGYHLNALYSPWMTWGEIAQEFVEAKQTAEQLKTWTNTRLGECFADIADAPDWRRLAERAEDYEPSTVPAGGVVLTAGADVQDDRIEVEVVAWSRGHESWSVDHRILVGDPAQPEVWRRLDALLAERFPTAAGGALQIRRLCIDTGGHHVSDVHEWAARHPGERVMAIQGRDSLATAIGTPTTVDVNLRSGKRKPRGGRLWPVGVSLLKSRLFAWLASDPPRADEETPHGFCHFPKYGDEYFKQLCAERKVKRKTRTGYVKFEWEKVRERNEVLDCRVYAMAAMETLRLDRWTEADWQAAEAQLAAPEPGPARPSQPRVRRSSWLE